MDLDEYLEGGADEVLNNFVKDMDTFLKPQARKIRNYLYGILEDALEI